MKKWTEYTFDVNGLETRARYNEETVRTVFLPLLQELTALQEKQKRRIVVFMAAPPAVGKSTLAEFLSWLSVRDQSLMPVQAIGMDGFHYHADYIKTHTVLRDGTEVPMQSVKGCPETFDVDRLTDKIRSLRQDNITWPVYDRTIHDVREDALYVKGRIVLIEGNYLLLKERPWNKLSQYADYTIRIDADEVMLFERLVSRKIKGGSTRRDAERFCRESDLVNVRRVLRNTKTGDLNLTVTEDNDYILA